MKTSLTHNTSSIPVTRRHTHTHTKDVRPVQVHHHEVQNIRIVHRVHGRKKGTARSHPSTPSPYRHAQGVYEIGEQVHPFVCGCVDVSYLYT